MRRLKTAANVALQIALATWLLVIINIWAFHHSWRHDLTSEKRYAVDPETEQLLRELPRQVQVVIPFVFGPGAMDRLQDGVLQRAIRLLREFELRSPSLRLTAIVRIDRDPEGWKSLQERFEIEQHNQIYFFSGDRREALSMEDLAVFEAPGHRNPQPVLVSERVAEALAAALRSVTTEERPRVLFTQGSGEIRVDAKSDAWSVGALQTALRDRGYDVGSVALRERLEIPADTRLVVIVAGGRDEFDLFLGARRDAILRYLDGGGSLLLFLPVQGRCGLEPRLRDCGIRVQEGAGIIYNQRVTRGGVRGATPRLQVTRFTSGHPITRGFRHGSFFAELTHCRSLEVEEPATGILLSSDDSWLERTPDTRARRDADEPTGPFNLLATYDPNDRGEGAAGGANTRTSPRGRLAVVGSWYPALDPFFQGDARRVLLNTIYWLTDRANLAAAPGREPVVKRIPLTPTSKEALFWTSVVVVPLCSVLGGLFVSWMRRPTS